MLFPQAGDSDPLDYIEIKTIFSPKDTSENEEGERLCVHPCLSWIYREHVHIRKKKANNQPLDRTGLSQEVLHLANQHRKRFLTLPENHKLQPQSKQQTIDAGEAAAPAEPRDL